MNPADRDAWAKHIEARTRANLRPGKYQAITGLLRAESIRASEPGPAAPKPNKYKARPMVVDGIRFDSTHEANRYQELKLLQSAGNIGSLELQPMFPLQVVELFRGGPPWVITCCGIYTADFRYTDHATGEIVVEDTKSDPTKTTDYKLRKYLAETIHGITVREL
jgi:hypothetical protein